MAWKARHLANKPGFNAFITVAVLVNSLLVGIEVDAAQEVVAWDRIGFVIAPWQMASAGYAGHAGYAWCFLLGDFWTLMSCSG